MVSKWRQKFEIEKLPQDALPPCSHAVTRNVPDFPRTLLNSNDCEISPELDGYVIGPGSKKQELRETHKDGDMLGFDMTIQGPDGKPLKVSVLSKRTGDNISGVFLDYSGTPGTWTAVRQPQHR